MEYAHHKRDAQIRACQKQVIAHLSNNPEQAAATHKITGTVSDGLKCAVTQGRHQANMDMGQIMGGDGSAPSPGFFAKAGLVGCLAIATKMTAARNGLRVRAVDVEMETDTDTLAIFELGSRNAAPLETRIKILIDTDEPADVVDDLVAHADNRHLVSGFARPPIGARRLGTARRRYHPRILPKTGELRAITKPDFPNQHGSLSQPYARWGRCKAKHMR